MEGYVRKRGAKWYYSFEASSVNGKRKRIERVGGKTKKEASSALRKALAEFENTGLLFEPSDLSVADYFDYWYKEYVLNNCKYNTQMAYQNIIDRHIKPELGIYKLKGLQPAALQEFINKKYNFGSTKTSSSTREIPIGDTLCDILKQHKKWQAANRLKYNEFYTEYYIDDDNRLYTLDKSHQEVAGPCR